MTVTSLIRPLGVVPSHKFVEISLDFFQRAIELLAESDFVEFLLDRLIESFHGPVGLRMPDLDPRMLDLVELQEELISVLISSSAILRPVIAEYAQYPDTVFIERR